MLILVQIALFRNVLVIAGRFQKAGTIWRIHRFKGVDQWACGVGFT